MTSFVVDASAFDFTSPLLDSADAVFAPDLIDLEVANVLRTSILRGERTSSEATTVFTEWIANPVQRTAHGPTLELVWSLRHTITPYDAAYVALAMQLEIALLTADRRLAAAAAAYCDVIIIE